jgi:hypothetical protein
MCIHFNTPLTCKPIKINIHYHVKEEDYQEELRLKVFENKVVRGIFRSQRENYFFIIIIILIRVRPSLLVPLLAYCTSPG